MDFLRKDIEAYAERHTTAPNALLQKIARETHLHVVQPGMLSGYLQGRLLAMLAHMIKPKRSVGNRHVYWLFCPVPSRGAGEGGYAHYHRHQRGTGGFGEGLF